jgi:hypothetical protein
LDEVPSVNEEKDRQIALGGGFERRVHVQGQAVLACGDRTRVRGQVTVLRTRRTILLCPAVGERKEYGATNNKRTSKCLLQRAREEPEEEQNGGSLLLK